MLFLVLLHYTRPLATVDQLMQAHRAYLDRHYDAGHFVLSGRKEPRTGGVIVAKATSASELSLWLAEDPFLQHGVATYDMVAWVPTRAATGWPLGA